MSSKLSLAAANSLRDEAHDYITEHFDELVTETIGRGGDPTTQTIAGAAAFDLAAALEVDTNTLTPGMAQSLTVLMAGYIKFYVERTRPE